MRARQLQSSAAVLLALSMVGCNAKTPGTGELVDILIKGGTVYDGSEAKPYVGDVAIKDDKIVFVGPKANLRAKRTINAKGMIVSPGFIDGHTHSDHLLNNADPLQRQAPPYVAQGVSTVLIGVDGGGLPELKSEFDKFTRDGVGVNMASYVGYGTIRKRVIGDDARAPTAAELAVEKGLVTKGMCEGAIGLSTGLFYAPQSFAKTDEVIELAKEAAKRGGIYDTHQRDESSYSIGIINSTKEVLQIGREANIPVHFGHIKALGNDVWGKSTDVIKLIETAKANGQNVTADQYPWLASHTGLSAALVPRWAVDGGYAAMIKRFNDPVTFAKIRAEMVDNLRRRNGPHSILFTNAGHPWTGKYLDEVAKEWKVDPIEAAVRILRQTEQESIVSFNMSQADVDNFMKQPWAATSSDGGPGHPREYATFAEKYSEYVHKRHVIAPEFFIRHSTGLAADMFMLDHRGYLRPGYYADVVVLDPNRYAPKADYVHWNVLTEGVVDLLVNGKLAVDNGKITNSLSGRPIRHTPTAGSCV